MARPESPLRCWLPAPAHITHMIKTLALLSFSSPTLLPSLVLKCKVHWRWRRGRKVELGGQLLLNSAITIWFTIPNKYFFAARHITPPVLLGYGKCLALATQIKQKFYIPMTTEKQPPAIPPSLPPHTTKSTCTSTSPEASS